MAPSLALMPYLPRPSLTGTTLTDEARRAFVSGIHTASMPAAALLPRWSLRCKALQRIGERADGLAIRLHAVHSVLSTVGMLTWKWMNSYML